MRLAVVLCAVVVGIVIQAGAASAQEYSSVTIYDVAPSNARPLGPVSVTACDRPIEVAKDRLLSKVQQQGGNGISEIACVDTGINWSCWSSVRCDALALNIPPPTPVRPVQSKRRR